MSLQNCNGNVANSLLVDSKQARDLIGVLKESNQQIDPRLSEMGRFGGGGGSSGRYSRGRIGGGRGGRGSGSYAFP